MSPGPESFILFCFEAAGSHYIVLELFRSGLANSGKMFKEMSNNFNMTDPQSYD